jgi:drug/metabolite transporter (DMT)-like permease
LTGLILGLGTALTWGIGNVLVKSQVDRLTPGQLLTTRALAGALASLGALVALGRASRLGLFDVPHLLALGGAILLGYFGADILFVHALERLPVSQVIPIQASYPLVALVLAVAFLQERVTWLTLAGALVVVAGVSLVGAQEMGRGPHPGATDQRRRTEGVLLSALSSLFWGGSAILLKVGLEGHDALAAASIIACATALAFLVFFRPWQDFQLAPRTRAVGIAALAGALGGTGLSNVLYVLTVDVAGVTRASVLASTSPVFTAILAVIGLRERLTPRLILCTLMITVGIWLVSGG